MLIPILGVVARLIIIAMWVHISCTDIVYTRKNESKCGMFANCALIVIYYAASIVRIILGVSRQMILHSSCIISVIFVLLEILSFAASWLLCLYYVQAQHFNYHRTRNAYVRIAAMILTPLAVLWTMIFR